MFVMTLSREADKRQGYAELDDAETRALAQLVNLQPAVKNVAAPS